MSKVTNGEAITILNVVESLTAIDKSGNWQSFKATLIHRVKDINTALMQDFTLDEKFNDDYTKYTKILDERESLSTSELDDKIKGELPELYEEIIGINKAKEEFLKVEFDGTLPKINSDKLPTFDDDTNLWQIASLFA